MVTVYILIVLITRSLCTADEYMGFLFLSWYKINYGNQLKLKVQKLHAC